MLPSEQILFNKINVTLSDIRSRVLYNIVSGKPPSGKDFASVSETFDSKSSSKTLTENSSSTSDNLSNPLSNQLSDPLKEGYSSESSSQPLSEETKELKTPSFLSETGVSRLKIRFMETIEEIIGPDLQIYGPFETGAVAELPKELATALINKKQAEGL